MIKKFVILVSILILVSVSFLKAQQISQANMMVQVEVTDGIVISFNHFNLVVESRNNIESDSLVIDPASLHAGVLTVSGTPGKLVILEFPDSVKLVNQDNHIVDLTNFSILYGLSANPADMHQISMSDCRELTIPESGRLVLRVGGTIKGTMFPNSSYQGEVTLDSRCL